MTAAKLAIPALKAAISLHLGVGLEHLGARFDRLAATIAAGASKAVEYGVERLGEMSLRDLCMVLAEGPDQQTRALMLPEEVRPHAHQGVGGVGEPVSHEEHAAAVDDLKNGPPNHRDETSAQHGD